MSRRRWILLGSWVLLATAGCEREKRRFSEPAPTNSAGDSAQLVSLTPGQAPPPAARPGPYEENAYSVSEGKRLYTWFNCVGCHSHGGGGMGPPLMDNAWRYGSEPENVYLSIVQGRPNGMPSFRGKIPEQQIWQLVAYVRSMSGLLRKDVAPGRDDSMAVRPQESSTKNPPPVREAPGP